MRSSFWSKLRRYALGGMAVGIFTSGAVLAQDASPDIMARLDALEKKNKELEQKLHEHQVSTAAAPNDPQSVEKIVTDLLKTKEEEQKKRDAEKKQAEEAQKAMDDAATKAAGYEVGSDLSMPIARWGPNGLQFESKNGDFIEHIGGRFDYDTVFWNQPAFLQGAPAGGSLGIAGNANRKQVPNVTKTNDVNLVGTTGLGNLDDGEFFRRIRIRTDGRMYDVFEYTCEIDFENLDNIVLDSYWVGMRDIPFLGTVRVGQHKVPQGLESYSSSYYIETLERSSLYSTFWNEFGGGIFISNNAFDQRVTWAYQYARPTTLLFNQADNFGDGVSMQTGRITFLPIYADDGRELLHLGVSFQHKTGDVANNQDNSTITGFSDVATSFPNNNVKVIRFRSVFDVRDSAGNNLGGSASNGIQNFAAGDSTRAVDTGDIVAPNGTNNIAGELLGYFGPFYIQAEANLAVTPNAGYAAYYTSNKITGVLTATQAPAGYIRPPGQTLDYWGYYVQAGCFLTGENRGYDRRFGLYDRVRPNENFFFTRDASGKPQFGMGAWELLYRYDFLDLDSKGIDGGRLGQSTFGLNWYLTPNIKVQVNALLADRTINTLVPSPAAPKTLIFSNAPSGQIEGLGVRMHLDF